MQISLFGNNMFSRCLDTCTEVGYAYAGMVNGAECYCDNRKPSRKRKLEESSCNVTCSGGGGEGKCGGPLAVSVYQTGMKPVLERETKNDTTGLKY